MAKEKDTPLAGTNGCCNSCSTCSASGACGGCCSAGGCGGCGGVLSGYLIDDFTDELVSIDAYDAYDERAQASLDAATFRRTREGYILSHVNDNIAPSEFIVPSSYMDEAVAGIDKDAFDTCTFVISIAIPSSVTSIPKGAFDSVEYLREVLVDEDNEAFAALDNALIYKMTGEVVWSK